MKAMKPDSCHLIRVIPILPPLSTRLQLCTYKKATYRRCKKIQRLFPRLMAFRNIFSRFDKLDFLFIGFT